MLNKVMIIGRLGQDPEIRYMQNGNPVANLRIATSENYTDKDGNKQEKTEWHRVVVYNKAAENCNNYLRKGSLVYVEGSLQTRKWTDQQNVDRYTTEINARTVQFLDRKGDSNGASFTPNQGGNYQQSGQQNKNSQQAQEEDYGSPFPSEASSIDDMPF